MYVVLAQSEEVVAVDGVEGRDDGLERGSAGTFDNCPHYQWSLAQDALAALDRSRRKGAEAALTSRPDDKCLEVSGEPRRHVWRLVRWCACGCRRAVAANSYVTSSIRIAHDGTEVTICEFDMWAVRS
jgi:hypothetical protein